MTDLSRIEAIEEALNDYSNVPCPSCDGLGYYAQAFESPMGKVKCYACDGSGHFDVKEMLSHAGQRVEVLDYVGWIRIFCASQYFVKSILLGHSGVTASGILGQLASRFKRYGVAWGIKNTQGPSVLIVGEPVTPDSCVFSSHVTSYGTFCARCGGSPNAHLPKE